MSCRPPYGPKICGPVFGSASSFGQGGFPVGAVFEDVQQAEVWPLVHASKYTELAPILAALIPTLETAARSASADDQRRQARALLADTCQATAAMMAKLGEGDAAWIAADRAAFTAEQLGDALAVAAATFRMAHVFLSLGETAQAWQAAASVTTALEDRASASRPDPAVLSLYGACQLVLAIAAARDNDRAQAHEHLDQARKAADLLGEDRDDYGTEFGPTNVAIHAVAVAVDLGDAGQALDLAQDIEVTGLSPERQARYLIDLAAAHAMRRQIGDALHDLEQAEELTPEQTRTHRIARQVARDLLQLAALRPRPWNEVLRSPGPFPRCLLGPPWLRQRADLAYHMPAFPACPDRGAIADFGIQPVGHRVLGAHRPLRWVSGIMKLVRCPVLQLLG